MSPSLLGPRTIFRSFGSRLICLFALLVGCACAIKAQGVTTYVPPVTGPIFCTSASERVYIKLSIVDRRWFCALGIM